MNREQSLNLPKGRPSARAQDLMQDLYCTELSIIQIKTKSQQIIWHYSLIALLDISTIDNLRIK
jgi:hypothetical protein